MNLGAAGEALIKSFEQLRLTAYQDQAGVWTIGWGSTAGVSPGQTCTEAEAEARFQTDTSIACAAVHRLVNVPISQNQFDALVSFTFNVGAGALKTSTLLNLLDHGDMAGAADQFLRWNHDNGLEDAGLTRRRTAERALFLGLGS